jgi:hypothetical protein
VINRAELEIGVESYDDLFQPPQSTQYLLLDEDNFFIPTNVGPKGVFTGISKSEFVVSPFIRRSDTTEGIFTGETSWFIGEIVKGISSDTTFSVFPAEYGGTLNRFVGENDKVLLKLYYSDLQ